MVITTQLKLAVGVLGNIATFTTSLAAIPTFWRIYKKRSTEEFSALPYAMSFACNLLWAWYALTKTNLLLLTISAAQVFLQALYLILYFVFTARKQKVKLLAMILIIGAILALDALTTLLAFSNKGERSVFAGSAATAASLVTYAAPLSVMGLVITTRSVEYMPLLLSLSILFNCLTWTVYGILGKDIFLMISDGLGSLLALAQLTLYALYYNAKPHLPVEEMLPPTDYQKEEEATPAPNYSSS